MGPSVLPLVRRRWPGPCCLQDGAQGTSGWRPDCVSESCPAHSGFSQEALGWMELGGRSPTLHHQGLLVCAVETDSCSSPRALLQPAFVFPSLQSRGVSFTSGTPPWHGVVCVRSPPGTREGSARESAGGEVGPLRHTRPSEGCRKVPPTVVAVSFPGTGPTAAARGGTHCTPQGCGRLRAWDAA